ncbi:helix-turn-helix domain-containing protein [Shinella sumterensis]|jgi:transcriptional regulator with XRE-family HTH domain|uniref:Helix-turn-helix transcriptional regulator n=1 Tax=Shinella sumterensis TaxID=1967501 RepID=A0AA50CSR0_9HYPH|nr:helix-turn-helix transcriptional regulator [Shinella sumterensis]TXH84916.1 MAG: XRE family transcriptional regulator [Rhizobium sp.]WLS01381.1 helix-turn-helix transcriptional regulator [Shinella sumterensis]
MSNKVSSKGPNPIDIKVGEKIRTQRRLRGLSQAGLGDALGVTFQQVQKYEKGTNRVSASRLMQIAGVLHMPVSHFFSEQEVEANTDSDQAIGEIAHFIETNEGRDLNLAFARIASPLLRKKIVNLVKAIAEPVSEE